MMLFVIICVAIILVVSSTENIDKETRNAIVGSTLFFLALAFIWSCFF